VIRSRWGCRPFSNPWKSISEYVEASLTPFGPVRELMYTYYIFLVLVARVILLVAMKHPLGDLDLHFLVMMYLLQTANLDNGVPFALQSRICVGKA
jgi:hypothetical protein